MIIGLFVIAAGAFSVYSVFTGGSEPFALFDFEGISIPLSAAIGTNAQGAELPNVDLVSAKILNSTSNVIAHLFLMGFIVSVGYRVAMIGVNLTKPIVVKVDKNKIASVLTPK